MNKKIMSLLMSAILCYSMVGTAFAATTDDKFGEGGDTVKVEVDGSTDKLVVLEPDGTLSEEDQKYVDSLDGSVSVGGQEIKDDTPVKPRPDPKPDPTPDDKDDDDDDDDSRGGGGGGASSKYKPINSNKNNQTPTPNTPETANQGWRSPSYYDVPSTEWYYNAVLYVSEQGMMAGNNGYFSPNDRLTRGMMAQILYNIEKTPGAGTASFPDVTSSDWFASAASWASTQGFMSGYSNGRFGPNDPITREQLAAILFRYSSTKGYNVSASAELSTFPDNAATSDWAVSAMRWAVGTGLLSGKTGVAGTRLDPTGTATRAEVAQILMNFGTKIAQ